MPASSGEVTTTSIAEVGAAGSDVSQTLAGPGICSETVGEGDANDGNAEQPETTEAANATIAPASAIRRRFPHLPRRVVEQAAQVNRCSRVRSQALSQARAAYAPDSPTRAATASASATAASRPSLIPASRSKLKFVAVIARHRVDRGDRREQIVDQVRAVELDGRRPPRVSGRRQGREAEPSATDEPSPSLVRRAAAMGRRSTRSPATLP